MFFIYDCRVRDLSKPLHVVAFRLHGFDMHMGSADFVDSFNSEDFIESIPKGRNVIHPVLLRHHEFSRYNLDWY